MKFEIFNKKDSNLKIAFFSKKTFGNIFLNDDNIDRVAKHNDLEIHCLDVDFLDSGTSVRGGTKEHRLNDCNPEMKKLYNFSLEYLKNNNIKMCIFFGSGYPWTKIFLEKIKNFSYVACYFADDPEGSEETSKYYVKNYHYAFCGGIYFNSEKRISEKYIEWGARKSKFIPLGACPDKYSHKEVDFDDRDIDIIYVGGAYLKKILRVFKLKKHFGDRMKLYGRGWNYHGNNVIKIIISRVVKGYYGIPEIEELSRKQLVKMYRKTKIGFNMHLSYGPSNQRLYELPINGVAQICDCEKNGLSELYEINKEVIAYGSIKEAIRKIEYYLNNEDERVEIAKEGYKKVSENYLLEYSFKKIKEEMILDIEKNYLNIYTIYN